MDPALAADFVGQHRYADDWESTRPKKFMSQHGSVIAQGSHALRACHAKDRSMLTSLSSLPKYCWSSGFISGRAFQLLGHIKLLGALLLRDLVHGRAAIGGRRAHQLARWRPDGRIPVKKHLHTSD